MQTFLPYQDFQKSLACLDNKRLGKQRVEALQILNTLTGKSNGWKNHPAVRMWRGYIPQLAYYHNLAIWEWESRGFKNNMKTITHGELHDIGVPSLLEYAVLPIWLTPEFCSSHRSNLLRKDYAFYSQYGWTEPIDLPYIWPV